MKYFFISGAPSTGKTTTIHAICGWLLSKGYAGSDLRTGVNVYTPSTVFPVMRVPDFSYILQKNGIKVLVHSATDDHTNINLLIQFIGQTNPDIVISSCRDYPDNPRNTLCSKLGLINDDDLSQHNSNVQEFPLAKITRHGQMPTPSYLWYFKNTVAIIEKILTGVSYNL